MIVFKVLTGSTTLSSRLLITRTLVSISSTYRSAKVHVQLEDPKLSIEDVALQLARELNDSGESKTDWWDPDYDEAFDDEEGDMDLGDEDPMDDKGVMEALRGVNLELSEDEVVQEVAKRVAKRILKAKQAQARLDEALGNKRARKAPRRPRRSRRTRK